MTPRVTVNLNGVKDLIDALKSLPERVEKNVLRFALRAAAKPILTGAKIRAPVKSGNLKKSLKIKAAKRSRKNKHRVTFTIGTGSGHQVFADKAFYGGWQELGWLHGKRSRAQRDAQKTLISSNKEIRRLRNANETDRTFRAQEIRKLRKVRVAAQKTNERGRRRIPGLHYVQRAFNDNAERSKNGLEQDIRTGLLKEVEKAAKKQAVGNTPDSDE